MRDIGRRIQRYRLSRYAAPRDPVRSRLGWAWIAGIAWLAWIGVISDHSLLQIWKLTREQERTAEELALLRGQHRLLESQLDDPAAQRDRAEHRLRRDFGMAWPGEIVYRVGDVPADSLTR